MFLSQYTASEIAETIARQNYYKYLNDALQNSTDISTIVPPSLANVSDPIIDTYLQNINDKFSQKKTLEFSVRDGGDITPYRKIDYDIAEIGTANLLRMNSYQRYVVSI